MRFLPGLKSPFFIRLTTFVLIVAFTWTMTAAGPAPATPKSAKDKAQAVPAAEKDKPKEEEMRPVAIAGKSSDEVVAKKKFPWLIVIGAVVVVGGVVAVLLLTKNKETIGRISVNSTPSAAKVYLDGGDTTKTTPCTLDNVSAGSHVVRIALDGYKDYTKTVVVTGGKTANVTATLTKHAITVSEPSGGSSKARTVEFEIRWATDSNLAKKEKSAAAAATAAATSLRIPGGGATGPDNEQSYTIDAVDIDLYKGSTKVATIATGSTNDGLEPWTAPAGQTLGSDYKIRVTCSTEATIYGESGSFSIVTQYGAIEVTSTPSGAKIWLDGTDTGQKTPIIFGGILRGTHHLKVEAAYFGRWEGDIQVVESQTTNVNANLTPYSYEFVTAWGTSGTGDGQFGWATGIEIDSNNDVYVSDSVQARIQKFTSNGTFLGWWGLDNLGSTGWHNPGSGRTSVAGTGNGQFDVPYGIGVDSSNNIYIADAQNSRIQKFTSNGTYITKWGSQGTGTSQFKSPYSIALDSSNNIYVVESWGNRVQKFTSDGTYVTNWGSQGTGEGQFDHPAGIEVDSSNRIYVADYNNHRIQKFTSGGTFISKWATLNGDDHPSGIAWDPSGVILLTEPQHHYVQKMSDQGAYIMQWGGFGTGSGKFKYPNDIAIDSSGYIYVADMNNQRIQKFRYVTNAPPTAKITYTPIVDK